MKVQKKIYYFVKEGNLVDYQAGVHKKGSFSISDLINNTTESENYSKTGAIVQFIGVVRGVTIKGDNVQKLKLEAYEEKANEILNKICKELAEKQGIVNVQIHHLLGEFEVGEDLVYVSVAGSHRSDVFPVLQEAVERYKNEVPVFKKELITKMNGEYQEYWISEKEAKEKDS